MILKVGTYSNNFPISYYAESSSSCDAMQAFTVGCIDDFFKGYMVKETSHGVPESTLPTGKWCSRTRKHQKSSLW